MKEDSNEKNVGFEEEKKEGSPSSVKRTSLEVPQDEVPQDEVSLDGLPSELKNIVFNGEGELWEAQEKIGLSDLQIVLNSEGYAVWREMPGTKHNAAVDVIRTEFWKWKQEQGDLLYGKKGADVFVSQSFDRNKKRCPDFAVWGPDRLNERGRIGGNARLGKVMNPHVIFQFGWGNSIENEIKAIDDMSLYAGVGDQEALERPNVIYFIKAIRKGDPNPQADSPVHGFDVYEVRRGDQIEISHPTLEYRVGGNEDVTIEVAPVDMGLPQDVRSPLLIRLSDIRVELEDVGVVFETENQDE